MKKLSIILIFAVLLVAMSSVLVVGIMANETIPDADAPEGVNDLYEQKGEGYEAYKLYAFESDEAAASGTVDVTGDGVGDTAIGRFSKAGGDGYALDWVAASGNSNACGTNILFLIKDVDASVSIDLERNTLTVDGSLGQKRTDDNAGKSFAISCGDGFALQICGGEGSALTLRDLTVNYSGSECAVDFRAAKLLLEAGVSISASEANAIIVNGAVVEIKSGSSVYAKGNAISVGSKAATNIIIDGGTFISDGDTIDIYNDAEAETVEDVVLTINGGDLTSTSGYVIRSVAKAILDGGTNSALPQTLINIHGGRLTAKAADKEVIFQGNSSTTRSKIINVYGGIFVSEKVTSEINDTNIAGGGTSHGDVKAYGVVYSQADIINIHGGEFYLYSDDGKTLATESACVLTFGGGSSKGATNIYGGDFYGGKYLFFHSGTKAASAVADKYAMPSDGNCKLSLSIEPGAAVRTVAASAGIRFQGTITQDAIDYATACFASGDSSKICRGIAVVPVDFLQAAGNVFTFESISAMGGYWATTNAKTGWIDNEDGSYTVRFALANIKPSNFTRQFVAISYVCADTDGIAGVSAGDKVIYSDKYSEARSISEVAKAALADVKDEIGNYDGNLYSTSVIEYYYVKDPDGTFTKKMLEEGSVKYSRYTPTQLEVLKTFA